MAMVWPGNICCSAALRASRSPSAAGRIALQDRGDVVRALLLVLGEDVEDEPGEAALVAARLGEVDMSGGGAVLVALAAAARWGTAAGNCPPGRPGRSNRSPWSFGPSLILYSGGDRCRLRLGEAGAARIGEIAERHQLQRVTGRADLFVDLEAALQLRRVESAEGSRERPIDAAARGTCSVCAAAGGASAAREPARTRAKIACDASSWAAPAHALAPSTDSEIEFGSGLVFSKIPSSGSTIRKKAK